MSGFEEKIKNISRYRDVDFYNIDSIGIIGRGPSAYRLDLCYKKFNHCYLTGEFNNTLYKIEKYLTGKEIVLCIMQQFRYRTSEQNCKKFNIKNIQVTFQEGTKGHRKCIRKLLDLKVIGFTKKHYEIVDRINKNNRVKEGSIFSTGMSGIISALYFNPMDIYVIGFDFYNRGVKPYYVKENKDISHTERIIDSVKELRSGMIESIYSICSAFPDINLHLYTTYEGIKSKNNLNVIYV